MKKVICAVLCLGLIAGPVIAQDNLGPQPPSETLVISENDIEAIALKVAETKQEKESWTDRHPVLTWMAGIGTVALGVYLVAEANKGGDQIYNIGGDQYNSNGNGGNGSNDGSSTSQSTGMGNNER